MKNATQPNGIKLDARKLLEGDAELARQVGDARLVKPRPARPCSAGIRLVGRSAGGCRSRARTQKKARSGQSENGF